MSELCTIERVAKPAFEKAFNDGQRVAIVKDSQYWLFGDNSIGSRHDVPGPVGFTNDTVRLEDIYSDGPSRPGEAFRYWIVTQAVVAIAEGCVCGNCHPGCSTRAFFPCCGACMVGSPYDLDGEHFASEVARRLEVAAS